MSANISAQGYNEFQTRLVVWLTMFLAVAVCGAVLWMDALFWLGVGHVIAVYFGRPLGPDTLDTVITASGALFFLAGAFVFACLARGTLHDARRV
jgi:hypothetical protein